MEKVMDKTLQVSAIAVGGIVVAMFAFMFLSIANISHPILDIAFFGMVYSLLGIVVVVVAVVGIHLFREFFPRR